MYGTNPVGPLGAMWGGHVYRERVNYTVDQNPLNRINPTTCQLQAEHKRTSQTFKQSLLMVVNKCSVWSASPAVIAALKNSKVDGIGRNHVGPSALPWCTTYAWGVTMQIQITKYRIRRGVMSGAPASLHRKIASPRPGAPSKAQISSSLVQHELFCHS
jgi:hypothetical protein